MHRYRSMPPLAGGDEGASRAAGPRPAASGIVPRVEYRQCDAGRARRNHTVMYSYSKSVATILVRSSTKYLMYLCTRPFQSSSNSSSGNGSESGSSSGYRMQRLALPLIRRSNIRRLMIGLLLMWMGV